MSVIKLEVANEEARMLLADIMFARQDVPGATNHYSQLLKPSLITMKPLRLLHLLKSADRITEGLKSPRTAERSSARASAAPGLAFMGFIIGVGFAVKGIHSHDLNFAPQILEYSI